MSVSILKEIRGRRFRNRKEAEETLKEILDLMEEGEYLQAATGVRLLYSNLHELIIRTEKQKSTENPQIGEQ
jgi:hypothetical protein